MTYAIYPDIAAGGSGPAPAGGAALWFETLAAMGAAPGPATKKLAWQVETAAPYEFVPDDTTTVDGWSSVANTGGHDGRWLLKSERVSVGATDADQGARLSSAVAALAGKATIALRGERFDLSSPLLLVALTSIEGSPGTDLHSLQPNGAGQVRCVLFAPTPTTGAAVALSADPVVGSILLEVDDVADFPTGAILVLGNTNRWTQYTVITRDVATGAGTLTVERPILWQFLAGVDEAKVVTAGHVRNVTIDGRGMKISGTGDRAIEMGFCVDCRITNINIDASAGFLGIVASLEVGGLRNHFDQIVVTGNNVAQGGIALESQEASQRSRCHVLRATPLDGVQPGIVDFDCQICWTAHCSSSVNGVGFELNSGGAPGESTQRSGMIACSAFGNDGHGLQVLNGAKFVEVEQSNFCDNGQNGIYVSTAGTVVKFVGVDASRNTGNGLQTTAGTLVELEEFTASRNLQQGIDLSGELLGAKLRVFDNRGFSAIQTTGAAHGVVTDSELGPTTIDGGGSVCVNSNATGRLRLSRIRFLPPENFTTGARYAIFHQVASVIELSSSATEGAYSEGYHSSVAGTILRRGPDVDFRSCGVPFSIGATSRANFGTVSLTAGVGTFPWPLAHAQDLWPVVDRVSTAQGATGAGGILVTVNPGVGWVITAIDLAGNTVASDESTFAVWAE